MRDAGIFALLLVTFFVFMTVIYMLIIGPVIGPLYDETNSKAVENQGYSGQLELTRDVALVFVPTLLVIGILLYGYAATQKSESFFGGGPPR